MLQEVAKDRDELVSLAASGNADQVATRLHLCTEEEEAEGAVARRRLVNGRSTDGTFQTPMMAAAAQGHVCNGTI